MERIDIEKETNVILLEHKHRYNMVSRFASGNVLDIACGIGYGSKIVVGNSSVETYVGMDISEEALKFAKENFLDLPRVDFKYSKIENIPVEDSTIDTVISLETLEHVDDVNVAINEIHRVLNKEGIFIGSVPTEKMELRCREVYGENIFHKRTFSKDEILAALKKKFKFVHIGVVKVAIGSIFIWDDCKSSNQKNIENVLQEKIDDHVGSFIFIASNNEQYKSSILNNEFMFGMNFIDFDAEIIIPERKKADEFIMERDSYIKVLEKRISDLNNN